MRHIALAALALVAAPVAAEVASAPLTIDSPIAALAADPRAKAVLDEALPGLTRHRMYGFFKSMSLKTLQPMSRGKVSDAALAKIAAGLAAIK